MQLPALPACSIDPTADSAFCSLQTPLHASVPILSIASYSLATCLCQEQLMMFLLPLPPPLHPPAPLPRRDCWQS